VSFTFDKDVNDYWATIDVPELTSEIMLKGDQRVYVNAGARTFRQVGEPNAA
jgi:hypothetical protein